MPLSVRQVSESKRASCTGSARRWQAFVTIVPVIWCQSNNSWDEECHEFVGLAQVFETLSTGVCSVGCSGVLWYVSHLNSLSEADVFRLQETQPDSPV